MTGAMAEKDTREERLAQKLRENLRRRKALDRERRAVDQRCTTNVDTE
jgi:hypothetical protein